MALGDSIGSTAFDNFSSQRLSGATNADGTAMTNAPVSPSAWDAFRTSYDQYANPNIDPHADQTFYVPGVGNIARGYQTAPQAGSFQAVAGGYGGEGDGGTIGNQTQQQVADQQYQSALAAYNATPDGARYGYSTPHDFGALKGHEQSYGYDPTTGGVKIDGRDYDNSPDWNDKFFAPLVQAALTAAVGGGIYGAATGGLGAGAAGGGSVAGSTLADGSISGATFGSGFEGGSGLLNIGADAATAAQTAVPGFLDQAGSYLSQIGTQWGQLNPLLRTGLGSLASSAVSGLSGGGSSDGGSTNPFSSVVQSYTGGNDPAGLAALDSQSVASSGATPGLFDSYGSTPWYQSLLGKAGSNPVTSFANILSGNGQGADYSNALSTALGLGGSIYNGVAGSNAAKTAAGQQTGAINSANALTAAIYGDTVNRNAPFVAAGTGSVKKLADLNGLNGSVNQGAAAQNFVTSDPGFQFRMDQGNRAVQASAAGQGGLFSGRAFKDAQTYAQGLGSQEYSNAYGRLSSLATLGQNSANNTGLLGANYGNTSANLTTAGGIAQSAGTMGSTNAITNALSQFLKNQSQNGYYGT